VADLGEPGSYLTAREGLPVYASDGRQVGELAHVLADEEKDIFDGIVIATADIGNRFADAPQVANFYERGVELGIPFEQAERLPEPSENPAAMEADPSDTAEGELTRKLRNAWDRISGRY
jgi:hypothetical protein